MSDVEIRRNEIIELLYTYKKYSIDDFAKRFGVSRRTINYDMPRWYPLPQTEDCLGTSVSAQMLVMPGNAAFCAEKFSGSRE